MIRHVVKRPNGQTEKEIPVCQPCAEAIRAGADPDNLAMKFKQPPLTKPEAIVPAQSTNGAAPAYVPLPPTADV
jgi:hypothetical protein